MAIGDVVNGIGTATVPPQYFIPAFGVEICITSVGGNGAETLAGLSNGVTDNYSKVSNGLLSKIFITNTNYLFFLSITPTSAPAYSGIQIK
jgi:hypothetical protein